MVLCTRCGCYYKKIYPEAISDFQGNKCAAWVKDGVLYAGYGSTVADGQSFELRGETATLPSEGSVICDACIVDLKKQRALILISDHFLEIDIEDSETRNIELL